MNILYGIQGTGHGHISRAREILPALSRSASVDVLLSGTNCQMKLSNLEISYRRGVSLTYDSNGGVSYLKTALQFDPITFLKDIHSLDLDQYDLVVSDYEPISSWAAMKAGKRCIGLSHQAAFLSDRTPRPARTSLLAEQVLRHFAPCHKAIGFHFIKYDSFVEGPIIRREVRELRPSTDDHVTVYLPAFDHETLLSVFTQCMQVKWHVFSPLCDTTYTRKNVTVHPVGNESFLKSLESSLGVMTSAGFETCAESIYLGKKLMVLPIKNQYEQLCNAAALDKMGVPVVFQMGKPFIHSIRRWLDKPQTALIPQIADAAQISKKLIRYAAAGREKGSQKSTDFHSINIS
ncbi:MAG: hypothetical protein GVY08_05830 [Bacteroidetes bacterium]|nr:hypothetical protein [Bacteroidota bacterium]